MFVNNTAVGTSSSKIHTGMKEATRHLVPHKLCRMCATWRAYGPPESSATIQRPQAPGPHKPVARTSSMTKWGVARLEDLIHGIKNVENCAVLSDGAIHAIYTLESDCDKHDASLCAKGRDARAPSCTEAGMGDLSWSRAPSDCTRNGPRWRQIRS